MKIVGIYDISSFTIYALPFQKAQPTPQASDIDNKGIGDDVLDVTTRVTAGLRVVMKADRLETTRHGRRHRSARDASRGSGRPRRRRFEGSTRGSKPRRFCFENGDYLDSQSLAPSVVLPPLKNNVSPPNSKKQRISTMWTRYEKGSFRIPQFQNSATYSFETIFPVLFEMLLDFLLFASIFIRDVSPDHP